MQLANETESPIDPDVPNVKKPSRGGRRLLALYAASAASAVLMTLAAPPFDQAWLAWIAPTPLFWALLQVLLSPSGSSQSSVVGSQSEHRTPNTKHRSPLRLAFGLGFIYGFVYLLLLATWFAAFSPAGYPVAAACWGVLAGALSVALMVAARRVPVALIPPVLAAGWTINEWLHAQGTLCFPWGTLAASQYRNVIVLQMLDLTGAYGLTYLIALIAASFATALQGLSGWRWSLATGRWSRGSSQSSVDSGQSEHRTLIASTGLHWGLASLVLLGGLMVRGGFVLAQSKRPKQPGETVRLAVVQASESRQVPGAAVECISPFEDYESQTKDALSKQADLVLWPEAACRYDPVHDAQLRDRLERLLWESQAHLLVGSFVAEPGSGRTTNSSVMLSPRGQVLGQYAKVLIVPFGEYLPLRPLLRWTERLGMPTEDLAPGTAFTPLPWPKGKVGVSICFESAWGTVSREHVRRGANLLAVLTSDGWAGRKSAGLQHASFAPLRAVETRRSVARAAATGVSQLIDPYGRPHRQLAMFKKGVALADLPLRTEITPYVRLGDWPVGLSWLLLVGVPLLQELSRRRRKAAAPRPLDA